ncbi:hypothetical protein OH492_13250 [Vibrio chagasii]|nr:hypothetical protein [Vibrio chagasii]
MFAHTLRQDCIRCGSSYCMMVGLLQALQSSRHSPIPKRPSKVLIRVLECSRRSSGWFQEIHFSLSKVMVLKLITMKLVY